MPVHHAQRIEPLAAPQARRKVIKAAERDHPVPAQRARMHVANGPVGIVAERIDRLDAHHRPFERAHAVEGEREDHHAQDRVGADLVPGAVERHQAVDHPAPARHPQHDREDHAQRLRPIGQRGVVEVVRTRPDIEEDQRPEVDDRKPVGIDRAFGLLGHEVVHHRQEAGGQEEAHRVVAIPPLHQRALHPAKQRIAARAEEADRHVEVVDEVEHRHRQDEREVEPIRHIDVRFRPLQQRGHKHRQIGDPDPGEPQIDVPFRFSILLALRNAQKVASGRQNDEQLVSPEHEGRQARQRKPRAAGALDYVERSRDQRVAAEREDDRRCVQRPQPPEIDPLQPEIELRKRQFQRDPQPRKETRHAPEHRGDHTQPDQVIVITACIDRANGRCRIPAAQGDNQSDQRGKAADHHVDGKAAIGRQRGGDHREEERAKPYASTREYGIHGKYPSMSGFWFKSWNRPCPSFASATLTRVNLQRAPAIGLKSLSFPVTIFLRNLRSINVGSMALKHLNPALRSTCSPARGGTAAAFGKPCS